MQTTFQVLGGRRGEGENPNRKRLTVSRASSAATRALEGCHKGSGGGRCVSSSHTTTPGHLEKAETLSERPANPHPPEPLLSARFTRSRSRGYMVRT